MAAGASPPPCVTSLQERLAKEDILFQDTMDAVDEGYVYEPKPFVNAGVVNEAGTNAASCKIFSMGKLASFSKEETLKCFGEVYRGVLDTPEGSDHGNIRNFMAQSWEGMEFPEGVCLTEKA